MSTRITITGSEQKASTAGKKYLRVKTDLGWASLWGADDIKALEEHVNGVYSADVIEKGDFKNLENLEFISALPSTDEAATTSRTQYRTPEELRRKDALDLAGQHVLRWEELTIRGALPSKETEKPPKLPMTNILALAKIYAYVMESGEFAQPKES